MTFVCAVDGVPIAASRTGHLVHTAELPPGIDPDHTVVAVNEAVFRGASEARTQLRAAAEDMLAHHATLHPAEGCAWAENLARALQPR